MEQKCKKTGYLMDEFRLFHLNEKPLREMDYHYHEFCKVFVLLSGSGGYFIEGSRYALEAGDVVLIGKNQMHRPEFMSDYPYERIIIYIDPEFLQRHSVEGGNLEEIFDGMIHPVLRLHKEEQEQMQKMLQMLERELSGEKYGREIMSNALLLQMLILLQREVLETEELQMRPLEAKNPCIVELLNYIEEHFTEEILIEDLAKRFFVSKYYLMRLFQKETGQTIHGYITERRLLLARNLIRQGKSATESSFQAGFYSYSSFTRAHKKRFGTTPTGIVRELGCHEATYE